MSFWYRKDGSFGLARTVVMVVVVIAAIILSLGFVTGLKKTPRDRIGISYGGGVFEGAHFQKIVQPGSNLFFNGMFDKFYLYPSDQRSYTITRAKGRGDRPGVDFVEAASSDGIRVDFEVVVNFRLNQDLLQQFHEKLGLKYRAWEDVALDSNTPGIGWDQMLDEIFRPQIEFAIQREARKYDAVKIYSDRATLETLQRDIGAVLKDNITRVIGAEYFCGPTYVPGSGVCPDFTFTLANPGIPQGLKDKLTAIREAEAQVEVRRQEVEQAKQQALAIRELNEALAEAGNRYILLQAITLCKESGGAKCPINFWVLPAGTQTDLNVSAPSSP